MASTLSPSEEAQLAQTIEMFEVITQSQPQDYQSLEILKEAYAKVGRDADAISTSKRIAEAYVQMGQLSSAILEYETILQRQPDDPDVQKALAQIESRATSFSAEPIGSDTVIIRAPGPSTPPSQKTATKAAPKEVDDGRRAMHKIFVDGKLITSADFDSCWPSPDGSAAELAEPFIQVLSDKGILPVEKSLKILSDKSRVAFLPLGAYEVDMDLARGYPREVCKRWCIVPFDRMSKSVFVATANPFNQQAAKELSEVTNNRLLWYLVPPVELLKILRKLFR